MRQAADILSSAPAMQIRQLEAYQAMAKSANSKVIFIPTSHQNLGTMPGLSAPNAGPSNTAMGDQDFQNAITSHVAAEL